MPGEWDVVGTSPAAPSGLITPGNIDLTNRPVIKNPDGTTSTVRTITAGIDGKTYLLPTAVGGKIVSNDEAIQHFRKTGEHMGAFDSEQSADAYDRGLHNQMGWNGAPGSAQDKWQHPDAGDGWNVVKQEPIEQSVPAIMGDQAKRAIGAAWETVSAVPHSIAHPIDTARSAFNYTADAIGRLKSDAGHGDYQKAATDLLGTIPLVGPQAEQIAGEIRDGKYAEAIGHAAALRALAEAPEAAANIAGKAPAAARAVGSAVAAGGPDVAIGAAKTGGAAAAGYALSKLGEPGQVIETLAGLHALSGKGILADGIKQMGRGIKTGYQAGKASLAAEPAAAAAAPPSAAVAIPPARQLPAGGRPMPPPADASGVIPNWKPTILEPEPPAATPPARQLTAPPPSIPMPAAADTSGVIRGWKPTILEKAPVPADPLVALRDEIAQSPQFGGAKDFAAIKDPRAQAAIQSMAKAVLETQAADAARAAQPPAAAPQPASAGPPATVPPVAPPAPEPPPETAGPPAATPPKPAAPAAPAAAPPPGAVNAPPADKLPPKWITERQMQQWATDNGLSASDAEARLGADHNTQVVDRASLNRTLHAITGDHETLSGIAKNTYGVDSLKKLSDEQMLKLVDQLSKEQAAPEPDLGAQLQQSIDEARARRTPAAAKLGPPATENPAKTAHEARRAARAKK